MQKVLVFLAVLSLTACADFSFPGVYKIDVEQGNIVTQAQVDKLRPGMTQRQVRYILGTPLVVDTFHQERWDYLYTMKPGKGERRQNRLSLFFTDEKLTGFSGSWVPGGGEPAQADTAATAP